MFHASRMAESQGYYRIGYIWSTSELMVPGNLLLWRAIFPSNIFCSLDVMFTCKNHYQVVEKTFLAPWQEFKYYIYAL